MLYLLFHWLTEGKPYAYSSPLFRATVAVMLGFVIVWLLAPPVIRMLVRLKVGDQAEFDHDKLNAMLREKKNTPTMGGVLIVFAIFVCGILLADITNFYVQMALLCLLALAALGGVDDWLKLTASRRAGTRDGLKLWEKLIFQVGLAALLAMFVLRYGKSMSDQTRWVDVEASYSPYYNVLSIPFYKGEKIGDYYGVVLSTPAFAIITIIVIAGTSNAVNLTDGMDGLASGCVVLTAFAFMILAYVVGSPDLSARLLFFHIPGSRELAVICGAVVGACMGFLWFNAFPARVFMGDTGALPLGGLIGYIAIVTRLELMLLIVGGVFVIEAVSVLAQIAYFRATGGGRLFKCAPIHHHFHLSGWTETQTVTRFWLLAALFAAFALATIKLR